MGILIINLSNQDPVQDRVDWLSSTTTTERSSPKKTISALILSS